MNITLLQPDLFWHDPVANRAMLEERIFSLPEPTDLIVLPEMFTTGFTMEAPAVAEPMNLTTFRWLKQMAAQTGAVVTGSYVVQEKGQYFNRLIWMQPDGQFDTYDKRHLFRMAGEDAVYTAGTQPAGEGLERVAHLPACLLRPPLPGLEPQPADRRRLYQF